MANKGVTYYYLIRFDVELKYLEKDVDSFI